MLNLLGFFGPAIVHAIWHFVGKKVNGKFVLGSLLTPILLTEILARYAKVERPQHVLSADSRIRGRRYMVNTSSVHGGQLPLMNRYNTITWTNSSPWLDFTIAAFQANFLKKKKLRPDLLDLESKVHRLLSYEFVSEFE